MGIDAAWVTERDEPKQAVYDPRSCLTRLATTAWPGSHTTCLRFIDAFGDTVFNQGQIPVLLASIMIVLPTARSIFKRGAEEWIS